MLVTWTRRTNTTSCSASLLSRGALSSSCARTWGCRASTSVAQAATFLATFTLNLAHMHTQSLTSLACRPLCPCMGAHRQASHGISPWCAPPMRPPPVTMPPMRPPHHHAHTRVRRNVCEHRLHDELACSHSPAGLLGMTGSTLVAGHTRKIHQSTRPWRTLSPTWVWG